MPSPAKNPPLRNATIALALLATLAFEFARHGHSLQPVISTFFTAVTVGIVALAARWLYQQRPDDRRAAAIAVVFIVLLVICPFVAEAISRSHWNLGESPEIVQMLALRNLMLGLTAAAIWPGVLRFCCALSLFVTLGALMFMSSWPGYLVIVGYGIVGIGWLIGANWERMQGRFAAQAKREVPLALGTSSASILVGAVILAIAAFGGANSTSALGGWFYGSGGTGDSDPFAARGIGDGDQLVAAEDDAASFGAVESDLFLDSDLPSLYDMFNDMYGEPFKPKKQNERAIALSAEPETPKENKVAESRQSGREFSTIRRHSKRRPQELSNQNSNALIDVVGRVPLHLRLETFDQFDGRTWTRSSHAESSRSPVFLAMGLIGEKPWLILSRATESPALCVAEHHVIKILNLQTNRFPTPVHLTGAHIDKLDQLSFYGWSKDDVLEMPVRDRIPPLQVIHLQSRSFDAEKLLQSTYPVATTRPMYLALDDLPQVDRIADLAKAWTRNVPAGYPQIEAIVAHLQSDEFALDASVEVPEDCDNAAEHFLLHSRRGPDYLFASSATLLLRSLGYPTRIATGLYAREDRYNLLTKQTSVMPDDVHFWAEVCLDGNTWITVEPTPGYETLPPHRTWNERARIAVARMGSWMLAHPILCTSVLLLLLLVVVFRRELADLLYTLVWAVCQSRSARDRVLATIWLLERRAALAGKGRPQHATLTSWYRPLARSALQQKSESLDALLRAATQLLYAPVEQIPMSKSAAEKLDMICRQTVFSLTLRRLRQVPTLATPNTAPRSRRVNPND